MKRNTARFLSVILCMLLILSTSSCSKGGRADADFYGSSTENSKAEGVILEDNAGSAATSESGKVAEGRKIIKNIDLSLETKEFTALLEKLEKEIAELGGYVEESSTYGLNPESTSSRSANLIVRIPAEKSGSFESFLSENSVVTSRRISTEDVTLQYVDMESRVKALTIEKEALEELLKKAASVEEVINIRSQLTNVIHEIEAYESKLRTYDNLVDFCTVTIDIYEVERTSVVGKQSVWQEIGTNLKNNFANVGDFLVEFFVFAVSAIPYLLLLLALALIIVLPIKIKIKKKKKAKEATEKADDQAE